MDVFGNERAKKITGITPLVMAQRKLAYGKGKMPHWSNYLDICFLLSPLNCKLLKSEKHPLCLWILVNALHTVVAVIYQVMSNPFVTPWTVAHQAPLPMAFSKQEILEWVAISSPRGPSWPRDRTPISFGSYIGRCILYHWATWEILTYIRLSK